jgi:hypothetical protein
LQSWLVLQAPELALPQLPLERQVVLAGQWSSFKHCTQ